MKKIVVCSALLLSLATSSQAKPKPAKNDLTILSNRRREVYIKVDRSFLGGCVEVYDQNKACLEVDSISHTHTMIYFNEMPSGHYTVRVTKGSKEAEFSYDNI